MRFEHDCSKCVYLGEYTIEDKDDWDDGNSYDLWVCKKKLTKTMYVELIARWSNEGGDYRCFGYMEGSDPGFIRADWRVPSFDKKYKRISIYYEIYRRALEQGLVVKESNNNNDQSESFVI